MNLKSGIIALTAGIFTILSPMALTAQDLTASQIVDKMIEANNLSFERGEMQMTMIIENKRGKKRTRTILAQGQKFGELSKTRIEFKEPADVRGTTLLMHEQGGDADDIQYLYFPAFKKTQRISGSAKNGSFMGSDFTYADMESKDAKDGTKTLLPPDKVGGQDAYRISVKSTDEDSDYSKVDLWIHQGIFLPLRTDFYDRKGALLKVMTSKKIEKKNGQFVITHIKLVNKQKGSQTSLIVDDINQDAVFSESVFEKANLGK